MTFLDEKGDRKNNITFCCLNRVKVGIGGRYHRRITRLETSGNDSDTDLGDGNDYAG